MDFKLPGINDEYKLICPMLRLIMQEFERLSLEMGTKPVCTRILGHIEGDSLVHSAGLAADFRDEYDDGFLYTLTNRMMILDEINTIFPRTDDHMTIKHHSFKGGPAHFHVQCPPQINTLKKMVFNISGAPEAA